MLDYMERYEISKVIEVIFWTGIRTKSLAMIAMMAAAGHANELRVHLKGALKNGVTAEQIQEILLLLTLYCGIPASNEAHRIATEVLREHTAG